jgi:hypothetical protein
MVRIASQQRKAVPLIIPSINRGTPGGMCQTWGAYLKAVLTPECQPQLQTLYPK